MKRATAVNASHHPPRRHVALGFYRERSYAEERMVELVEHGFQVELEVATQVDKKPACADEQQFASPGI